MLSGDEQILTGGGAVAGAWDAEHVAGVDVAVVEADDADVAAVVEACNYCWRSTTASG